MSLSFKNRIAFHYMIATAVIMAIAFVSIFFVVQRTVIRNLDNDLSYEAKKHTGEITITGDSILFKNKAEWEEREHREIHVNPVFIQLIDNKGRLMDKSPNLKEQYLPFKDTKLGGHFDAMLSSKAIRQVQLPIEQNGKVVGYILSAMSSESALSIIQKLRNTLILSYLVILFGLYFISRSLAGRSIKPVKNVTDTITRITTHNLKERVELPQNKDEIHELSTGFNALLERIEDAIEREKQFTSDASHELRTPLATLRGTLEILIRKPRTQQEYEEKVRYSLLEIERMTRILEQLLMLARLDGGLIKENKMVPLTQLIHESLSRFDGEISAKGLIIDLSIEGHENFTVPQFYTNLIFDNLLSNAIKYSKEGSPITIGIQKLGDQMVCRIEDEGIGIEEQDIQHVYGNFYRSDALNHKHISGIGLGLSIAKKSADAIHAKLEIESVLHKGTTVSIVF